MDNIRISELGSIKYQTANGESLGVFRKATNEAEHESLVSQHRYNEAKSKDRSKALALDEKVNQKLSTMISKIGVETTTNKAKL